MYSAAEFVLLWTANCYSKSYIRRSFKLTAKNVVEKLLQHCSDTFIFHYSISKSNNMIYLLCSVVGVGVGSSLWVVLFCRRNNVIPAVRLGTRLGQLIGWTALMQSAWALVLQFLQRKPCRACPRNTCPQASHGVILRYVYSRHWWPPEPSVSRFFL